MDVAMVKQAACFWLGVVWRRVKWSNNEKKLIVYAIHTASTVCRNTGVHCRRAQVPRIVHISSATASMTRWLW